uniref:HDC08617 n=1 Tax=Drosophila melanogaster TaxID=7227 RepID=Q6ILR4_DROME|nr:TPA_inf: HDC08617 [Drosophila melanogaster]
MLTPCWAFLLLLLLLLLVLLLLCFLFVLLPTNCNCKRIRWPSCQLSATGNCICIGSHWQWVRSSWQQQFSSWHEVLVLVLVQQLSSDLHCCRLELGALKD